jgi:hypothetical protein
MFGKSPNARRGFPPSLLPARKDRNELKRAEGWEVVYRARAQRTREERESALAHRRGEYELRRDKLVDALVIGFVAMLLLAVAVDLWLDPDLISAAALCTALLPLIRLLSQRRSEAG